MVVDEFVVNVFFRLLMNLILKESMKILHLLTGTSRTIYSSDLSLMVVGIVFLWLLLLLLLVMMILMLTLQESMQILHKLAGTHLPIYL